MSIAKSINDTYRPFIIESLSNTFNSTSQIAMLLNSTDKLQMSLEQILTITDTSGNNSANSSNLMSKIDSIEQYSPIELTSDCVNTNQLHPLDSCVIVNRKKEALNSLKSNIEMFLHVQDLTVAAYDGIVDILETEIAGSNNTTVQKMMEDVKRQCEGVILKIERQMANLNLRMKTFAIILKMLKATRTMTGGKFARLPRSKAKAIILKS
jgi:hypothetical protein